MSKHAYWFPARTYGWGWGLPVTWQGWVVTIGYFVLLLGGIPLIEPASAIAAVLLATAALLLGPGHAALYGVVQRHRNHGAVRSTAR